MKGSGNGAFFCATGILGFDELITFYPEVLS